MNGLTPEYLRSVRTLTEAQVIQRTKDTDKARGAYQTPYRTQPHSQYGQSRH